MKIAFLGPQASFTQLAASQIFPEEELIPQSSILDCFNAVMNNEVDKAVVPLENSIEGTVSMTLDYLYNFDVFMETELVMPIAHHLMVHPKIQWLRRLFLIRRLWHKPITSDTKIIPEFHHRILILLLLLQSWYLKIRMKSGQLWPTVLPLSYMV